MIATPEPAKSSEEPVVLTSMDEFFARRRQAQVRVLPSDDKKYDEAFPEHSLSRVRAMLEHFRQHVQLNKKLVNQKPYRFKG